MSSGQRHLGGRGLLALALPLLVLAYLYLMLCGGDENHHEHVTHSHATVASSSQDDCQDQDCGLLVHHPDGVSMHAGHSADTPQPPADLVVFTLPDNDLAAGTSPAPECSRTLRPSGRDLLIANCVQRT